MPTRQLDKFIDLIAERTGLSVRERDLLKLGRSVKERMSRHGVASEVSYFQRLLEEPSPTSVLWRDLADDITTCESYFFRDSGQIGALRDHILPELIERNRECRRLRIWSAGCSSGEEPYTLAILLNELLPNQKGWDISILGTDLNPAVLEKARQGIFRDWSLRGVHEVIRQRYFRPRNTEWELDPKIRSQVTLREGNLCQDPFPNPHGDIHDFDLIVCRNVFIYFVPRAVEAVVAKFSDSLRDGGYLMTGHGEILGIHAPRLKSKVLPGSLVHQRLAGIASPPADARGNHKPVAPFRFPTHDSVRPKPPAAPKHPVMVPAFGINALAMEAQNCADRGHYLRAANLCHQLETLDPEYPHGHFLAAQLAEQRGALDEAERRFRRVIELAPDFIPAYIELGDFYHGQGDEACADKWRRIAIQRLRKTPPQTIIETYAPMNAGQLADHLQLMLHQP